MKKFLPLVFTALSLFAAVQAQAQYYYFPGTGSANSLIGGGTLNSGLPDYYATLPQNIKTKINVGSESFTIQANIKMLSPGTDNYPPIISDKDWNAGANQGFALAWHSATLKFNFVTAVNPRGTDLDTQIPLSDGQWHTVTIVVDRANNIIRAYDGATAKTNTKALVADPAPNATSFPINLAADGDANYNYTLFKGYLAQVKIFKGALSPADVAATWNKTSFTVADAQYANLVYHTTLQTINATNNGFTNQPVSANGVNEETFLLSANGKTINPTLTTLPVTFTQVSAALSGANVNVNWTTASEQNNDHFEVEASTDGKTFKTVKTVATKNGNSSTIQDYQEAVAISDIAGLLAIPALLGLVGFAPMSRRRKFATLALVGFVAATSFVACQKEGNSLTTQQEQNKAGIISGEKTVYIRIKQVDKNGEFSYSSVVVAK